MIDAFIIRFYELQSHLLRKPDYSAFVREASQDEKAKLLKKAAKIAKIEQRKVIEEAEKSGRLDR